MVRYGFTHGASKAISADWDSRCVDHRSTVRWGGTTPACRHSVGSLRTQSEIQ
jgi:hypothetical protein